MPIKESAQKSDAKKQIIRFLTTADIVLTPDTGQVGNGRSPDAKSY